MLWNPADILSKFISSGFITSMFASESVHAWLSSIVAMRFSSFASIARFRIDAFFPSDSIVNDFVSLNGSRSSVCFSYTSNAPSSPPATNPFTPNGTMQ